MRPIAAALILAGGRGSRLVPTHPNLPKPLVHVGGRSLVERNLALALEAVEGPVWIALGPKAAIIEDHVRRSALFDPDRVRFFVEATPLGTAGALGAVASKTGTTLALNVDLVTTLDVLRLLATHRRAEADFTIAVHTQCHRLDLGEVVTDGDGRVTAYAEKPQKSWNISSGVYLLEPTVVALIDGTETLGIPELVARALARGLGVHTHPHADSWVDVNDAATLHLAETIVPRMEPDSAVSVTAGHRRPLVAGIDLGATKTLAVLVDAEHRIVARTVVPTPREEGPAAVVRRAIGAVRSLLTASDRLDGAGIGFAGLVDSERGEVLSSIMLPGFDAYPLVAAFEAGLDVPVAVDNDATAAALGEFESLGSPKHLNMALLTVGTGIGGALIIDGAIYRGATGTAGEFGNMSIDWRGPACWCGAKGCLNALASGTALVRSAAAHGARMPDGRPPATVADAALAAAAGDPAARLAIAEAATCLGAGIANIVNILNPDRIALLGGVIELGAPFLDLVVDAARERAFKEPMAHVVIAPAILGYDTGAFGAAMLAHRRCFVDTPMTTRSVSP